MNGQLWWYASRAAGLMTWSTASASVIVGLLLMVPAVRVRSGPWFDDLHRILSSVSMIFLATHVSTLWLDSAAGFGWRDIVVPGESTWEPRAAAWGVIAAWAMVVVHLTSLARDHVSEFVWRSMHVLAVLTVLAGTYHAWLGGTDFDKPLTWLVAGLGSVLVIAFISVRLRSNDDAQPGGLRANDHQAILEEMRYRLENLPIPDMPTRPEMEPDSTSALPRRAQFPVDATAETDTATDDFVNDPFAAVPLTKPSPELGDWPGPSDGGPFDGEAINPFKPAQSTAMAISVPTEPVTVAPGGPPPLPEEAVDPATGKPDEAAYAAWLVEWLAYADRYGEETPEDPSRI